MNILHSTSDWLTLTKSWIYDQIRFMPENVRQTVWCNQLIDGPHTKWNGPVLAHQPKLPEMLSLKFNNFFNQTLLKCKTNINLNDYDVFFSHFGYRAWRDYQFIKGMSFKKVARFYGCDVGVTPKQPKWLDRYKRVFDEYNLFICEGPYMARELEKVGAPREKIKWLHIGIDPALFVNHFTVTENLFNPLRILIAATFTEKKGVEYALKGVLRFTKEYGHKVNLTLVGDANPAYIDQLETKSKINSVINQIKNEKDITLIQKGYVPLSALISFMQQNLILISPSITAKSGDIEGGFPVTLTQAAAKGMILIGTDHCDLPEIIRDGQNGFVCKQKSPGDISNAIKRIIDMNISQIDKMRGISRDIALNEFNQVKIGIQLYRFLSD